MLNHVSQPSYLCRLIAVALATDATRQSSLILKVIHLLQHRSLHCHLTLLICLQQTSSQNTNR